MSCGAVPIVSNLVCFGTILIRLIMALFLTTNPNPVFELAQAIMSLANSPERLAAMSESVRSSTVSHHPSNVAHEFMQCFHQMLNNPLL